MKHVRLAICDENGIATGELLEVDLNFFLPSNPALKSNMARIIPAPEPTGRYKEMIEEARRNAGIQEPLADWEKELLGVGPKENPEIETIISETGESVPRVKLYDVTSLHPEVINMDEINLDVDPVFDITLEEGEKQEDDWWDLYGLVPTHAFEVNHKGFIRMKSSGKILEPTEFDIDGNRWVVMVKINGMEYYLDGPKIAREMMKQGD